MFSDTIYKSNIDKKLQLFNEQFIILLLEKNPCLVVYTYLSKSLQYILKYCQIKPNFYYGWRSA